jgi:hypothetical protein
MTLCVCACVFVCDGIIEQGTDNIKPYWSDQNDFGFIISFICLFVHLSQSKVYVLLISRLFLYFPIEYTELSE